MFDLIMTWLKIEFKIAEEDLKSAGWYSRTSGWLYGYKTTETKGTAIYLRITDQTEREILSITDKDEITVPGMYAGPSNPSVFKFHDPESFSKLNECVADRIKALRHG